MEFERELDKITLRYENLETEMQQKIEYRISFQICISMTIPVSEITLIYEQKY